MLTPISSYKNMNKKNKSLLVTLTSKTFFYGYRKRYIFLKGTGVPNDPNYRKATKRLN